jgi:hypothetical protein
MLGYSIYGKNPDFSLTQRQGAEVCYGRAGAVTQGKLA